MCYGIIGFIVGTFFGILIMAMARNCGKTSNAINKEELELKTKTYKI